MLEIKNNLSTPIRQINVRAEFYKGSALAYSLTNRDKIKEITIDRTGAEKFIGYGVIHKLNIKLVDTKRELVINTENTIEIQFDNNALFPTFFVSQVRRNELNNELSITAYDKLYKAKEHLSGEIPNSSYTLRQYINYVAYTIGLDAEFIGFKPEETILDTNYENGANLDGKEDLRSILDDIAEATQSIYYISKGNKLAFKRLDQAGQAVLTIDKSLYFELDSNDNRRLTKIVSTTELGDNVSAELAQTGSTLFIRDNPFLDMREDLGSLLDNALKVLGGLTINQFNCNWRGNYAVEIGDKLAIITKDNKTVYSYLLNDTISYDGSFSEKTEWKLKEEENEFSNPTNLGEALKQTFARVDKANKQIELLVSNSDNQSDMLSNVILNQDKISATVKEISKKTDTDISNIESDLDKLENKVSATMTKEQIELAIENEINNGVSKVKTKTGFTFNDDGLLIEKSNSEISTSITENGMKVLKDNQALLTANNKGVDAVNLHASTYLIIGTNSRFEDYENERTGCFYLGGVD